MLGGLLSGKFYIFLKKIILLKSPLRNFMNDQIINHIGKLILKLKNIIKEILIFCFSETNFNSYKQFGRSYTAATLFQKRQHTQVAQIKVSHDDLLYLKEIVTAEETCIYALCTPRT